MKMKIRIPRGFTLIELLVVIAIIATLLAIMTPALNKAKKQVQATICLNNLLQIGLAANMYAHENDDYVPRGAGGAIVSTGAGSGPVATIYVPPDTESSTSPTWFTQFLPYLGHAANETDYRNVKIYRCPAFPGSGEGLNSVPNIRQTVCFVINAWTFADKSDNIGSEVTEPTKMTEFKVPMATAYLTDNEAGTWRPIIEDENSLDIDRCDIFNPGHLPSSDSTDVTSGRRIARDRHREGCNTLFLDWHAEYVPAEKMTIDMWRDKR